MQALLAILASFAPVAAKWLSKKLDYETSPEQIALKKQSDRDKAVISGDAAAVNADLDRLLDGQ